MVTTSKNSINVFVHSSKINIMMSNMHIIKKKEKKKERSLCSEDAMISCCFFSHKIGFELLMSVL